MNKMEKFINSMKKREGYISIETIIVAGLVIGLGAVAIGNFQSSGNEVVKKATDTVSSIQDAQFIHYADEVKSAK